MVKETNREDVQLTDSFIVKQSIRLFHIDFHLSVDQSLTVLTQLAHGSVIKGSHLVFLISILLWLHSLPFHKHIPLLVQ